MTNTNVSQVTALLKNMQTMSCSTEKSQKTDAIFGALLSQTASGGNKELYSEQKLGSISDSAKSNQAAYEKEATQSSFKDTNIVKKDNSDITSKLPQDAEEKIEAFTDEVKTALEEKLNVSEEEIVQAMEKLGLQILDLANPEKFTQLLMELMGSQDGSELLLSTDFQALMAQMEEFSSQLTTALNLTPEEFEQLMEQLPEMQQKPSEEAAEVQQTPPELEAIADMAEQMNVEQITVEQTTSNTASAEVETTEAMPTVKKEEAVPEEAEEETEEISTDTRRPEIVSEEQLDEGMADESGKQESSLTEMVEKSEAGEKNETHQQSQMSFQTEVQTVENGRAVEITQTVTHTKVDVDSILQQISQMTKISVTQAQSSIEMQLNPENLGKIYLQVVSKEGAIIAQLAAQNEAVKEVLESQIAILKDNMNQQGMKVEAIEVTIASHEFERNLEGNQDNPAKEQQEAEKTARRSINLNNLDGLEGLMSEEETLVAKIMQENGNSVDWTA